MPYFLKPSPTDFSELRAKLEARSNKNGLDTKASQLFYFNPNTISKDSLELLGFSSKQAWNTVNFRKKVKLFDSKQEMKKLYAMTDSLYQVIEPYILFTENETAINAKKFDKRSLGDKELFSFNPNTISKDSLVLIGFKPKTAAILIKFRKSTGGFKSKEELKKVYGVSEKLYKKIEPFILIQKEEPKSSSEGRVEQININLATKEELIKAKGIGETFSERIIEYRNKLGGFSEINQLEEVYGIDKDWIQKYGAQFVVKSSEISKININTIEFKALLKHPYFSYSEVKRIINYRDMHGKFKTLGQIRDNNLINPKQYRKIVSYLSLD